MAGTTKYIPTRVPKKDHPWRKYKPETFNAEASRKKAKEAATPAKA